MTTIPIHNSGEGVTVTFSLLDETGNRLNVVFGTFSVTDESGIEVQAPLSIVVPAQGDSIEAFVLGSSNSLAEGSRRALRVVSLVLTTTSGTVTRQHRFVIVRPASQSLAVMGDSFQPFDQAVFRAIDIAGIDAFHNATEDQQREALRTAYQRITKLTFSTPIAGITAPEFDQLHEAFRAALYDAQIIEANHLIEFAAQSDSVAGRIFPVCLRTVRVLRDHISTQGK